LNSITSTTRSKYSTDEIFCINTDSVITDPNIIANKFNHFFASFIKPTEKLFGNKENNIGCKKLIQ